MMTKTFFLHALSAMHVGVGQAIGTVDLPIARAKATNLPIVPGSALKGVLRDHAERKGGAAVDALFGPAEISGPDDSHAGAVAFGDAHLLLLPVRSLAGVMAWVSCPFVLRRYRADAAQAGEGKLPEVPAVADGDALLAEQSDLGVHGANAAVVFDDLDLQRRPGAEAWARHFAERLFAEAADRDSFRRHFALISDDNFAFLADTGTEIRARIRIDDAKGTVKQGALWYEENLPAESVLWGVLGIGRSHSRRTAMEAEAVAEALGQLTGEAGALIQIGGKATVGRGLARLSLAKGGA